MSFQVFLLLPVLDRPQLNDLETELGPYLFKSSFYRALISAMA